jgi:hypothetical protein
LPSIEGRLKVHGFSTQERNFPAPERGEKCKTLAVRRSASKVVRIALLLSNTAIITGQCPKSTCKYRELLAWRMVPHAKASVTGRYKITYGRLGPRAQFSLLLKPTCMETASSQFLAAGTEDPVKSIETIAHWVRLQGSPLARYRLRAAHGWQGNHAL